jgi:hypothetical protein|tara:strand:- start:13615 stop:14577 length:963 start_codon:yes stop_codon:yes gene_type:complete
MKILSILILSAALIGCSETVSNSPIKTEVDLDAKTSSIEKETESNENSSEVDSPEAVPLNNEIKKFNVKGKQIADNKEPNGIKVDDETRVVNDENLPSPPAPSMPILDFSGVYQAILSSYVSSSGKVNYASIKTNSEMLDQAIHHYQENTPKSSWSSYQKLAYWINAYNLFTIKLIIDNYPVSSIKNIAGGKPWDKKFIQLDEKTMSLNDIENGIIRKQFNEPRIHFAVNCASISCPKLLNKEYTSSNLNSLLESQAKRYINDKNENTFTSNSASISNIFDWYKGDFNGGVIPFLNKYLSTPLPSDAKITYQDYNWNLNN